MNERLKDLKVAYNVEKEKIDECIMQAFENEEISEDEMIFMYGEECQHLRCQFCLRMKKPFHERCHYYE